MMRDDAVEWLRAKIREKDAVRDNIEELLTKCAPDARPSLERDLAHVNGQRIAYRTAHVQLFGGA